MIVAALLAVAAGMVLVRLGWGGDRTRAIGGWLLALAGVVAATGKAGAWGCAVATLAGMTVALGAVLIAGWRSPARARRAARRAPAATASVRPGDVLRRLTVFLLVVPGAAVAAEGLAIAGERFARGHGAGAADATVLAWLVQPLAWCAVMTVQMTRAGPARMIAPLLAVAATGGVLWRAA